MVKKRKARVEGAAANVNAVFSKVDEVVAPEKKATKDAGRASDGEALRLIVDSYKAKFPEQWEAIALCPTQHGLEIMADALL